MLTSLTLMFFFQVLIQAMVTPILFEKAQWYFQCLNKMHLITFHNKHPAKMNFLLVRLRGSH